MDDLWNSVDNYFADQLLPNDVALSQALTTSVAEGLPAISVTPSQGMMLQLLARMAGARRNLERANVMDRVEVRVAPAADTLGELADQDDESFDFIFIDADKVSTGDYFEASLALSHPGTVIVVDNVVRAGAIADAHSDDVNVQGVRRFVASISADSRVSATAVQTVGSKGYDGFILAIVNAGHRRTKQPRRTH